MLEYIPLALAIAVLLKVEASLYDGKRDDQIYKRKLAEHCDRLACGGCVDKAEPVHVAIQNSREATAATNGSMRRKAP